MAITSKRLHWDGSEVILPATLDQLFLDATTSGLSTHVGSGGKMIKDYLPDAGNLNNFTTAAKNAASTYVHSSGVIPASAVSGLADISATVGELQDDGWVKNMTASTGVSIRSSFQEYVVGLAEYQSITDLGSATSATIIPGGAYRFNAVGTTSHYVNVSGNFVSAAAGRDARMQLMVGSAALVHFTDPLVLMNPLTPFAAHDLVIKFWDGVAQVYVQDINAGYIVDATTGTSGNAHTGTLYYGLKTAAAEFVTFDAEHTTFSTGALTVNKNKYLHGEGVNITVLSTTGTVATSTYTLNVYSLSLGNFTFTGNLVLNDCEVQSGSVVSGGTTTFTANTSPVYGTVKGAVVVQNGAIISGNSTGTINISSSYITASGISATFQDMKLTGGDATSGSAQFARTLTNGTLSFNNCVISGLNGRINKNNSGTIIFSGCSIVDCNLSSTTTTGPVTCWNTVGSCGLTDCYVSGCTATSNANALQVVSGGVIDLHGGNIFEDKQNWYYNASGGSITMAGSNVFKGSAFDATATISGCIVASSGAIVDLSGNTTAVPFNVKGGITFLPGGATVYPSGDTHYEHPMVLDNITIPPLSKGNVINLRGKQLFPSSNGGWNNVYAENAIFISGSTVTQGGVGILWNASQSYSGCTFSACSATTGGGVFRMTTGASASFVDCNFVSNTAGSSGGAFNIAGTAIAFLSGCSFAGNTSPNGNAIENEGATASVTLVDCHFGSGQDIYMKSGTVILDGSNTLYQFVNNGSGGIIQIKNGATIDLSGNAIATPISATRGIVVTGACTVINSGGAVVGIAGGTYHTITNAGVAS